MNQNIHQEKKKKQLSLLKKSLKEDSEDFLSFIKQSYIFAQQDQTAIIAFLTRRCRILATSVEELIEVDSAKELEKKHFVSDLALPYLAPEMMLFYFQHGIFPKLYIFDEILIYGRSLNRLLLTFEESLKDAYVAMTSYERDNIPTYEEMLLAFSSSLEIHVFAKNSDYCLLDFRYKNCLKPYKICQQNQWRELSKKFSVYVSVCGENNIAYSWGMKIFDETTKEILLNLPDNCQKQGIFFEKKETLSIKSKEYTIYLCFYPNKENPSIIFSLRVIKSEYQNHLLVQPHVILGEGNFKLLTDYLRIFWKTPDFVTIAPFFTPSTIKPYWTKLDGNNKNSRYLKERFGLLLSKWFLEQLISDTPLSLDDFLSHGNELNSKYLMGNFVSMLDMSEKENIIQSLENFWTFPLSHHERATELVIGLSQQLEPLWTKEWFHLNPPRKLEKISGINDAILSTHPLQQQLDYAVSQVGWLSDHHANQMITSEVTSSRLLLSNWGVNITFSQVLFFGINIYKTESKSYLTSATAYLLGLLDAGIIGFSYSLQKEVISTTLRAGEQTAPILPERFAYLMPVLVAIEDYTRGDMEEFNYRVKKFCKKLVQQGELLKKDLTYAIESICNFYGRLKEIGQSPVHWLFSLEEWKEETTASQHTFSFPVVSEKKWVEVQEKSREYFNYYLNM